jgi:hypothetical protein
VPDDVQLSCPTLWRPMYSQVRELVPVLVVTGTSAVGQSDTNTRAEPSQYAL